MNQVKKDVIEKLEQQQAAIAERIRVLKKKESAQERKRRTRRLILLGTLLEQYMDDPAMKSRVRADLDAQLIKDIDRQVFQLAVNIDAPVA